MEDTLVMSNKDNNNDMVAVANNKQPQTSDGNVVIGEVDNDNTNTNNNNNGDIDVIVTNKGSIDYDLEVDEFVIDGNDDDIVTSH